MMITRLCYVIVTATMMGCPLLSQTAPAADHHAHLGSPAAARLLKEKATTAADLIAALDAAGVKRAVALSDAYRLGSPMVHTTHEAAAVDAENEWTLHQAQQYPDRLVGFCSVNPIRPYALRAINHCAAIGLRGGLKLHLANARFHFADPANIRQLRTVFAVADRLRLPILIHLRSAEVWNGPRNVQIFMNQVLPFAPHVPVQVAHLGGWGGFDPATAETLAAFARGCEQKPGRCQNLYFDLSAVILSPASANAAPGSDDRLLWDEQKNFSDGPEKLARTLRRIGLHRILFGTDWPEDTPANYIRLLQTSLRLTPAELNQIFTNLAPYFPK